MGKICNERTYHLKCTGKLNCPLIAEKLVFEKNKNCIELAILSSSKITPGNFEFLKSCKMNHPNVHLLLKKLGHQIANIDRID